MKAKDFLNQAYLLDQQIKSKSEQVQSLNELATSCTATMTGMPHNPNRGTSRMADAVCKIVDLQESIAADMKELVELKAEIIATIKAVECVEYQLILEKRYISGKSWPEIAVDLGYKMRHLYKLHDEALDSLRIPEKYSAVQ